MKLNKKMLITGSLAGVLMVTSVVPAAADTLYTESYASGTVTADVLNVRSGASLEEDIVGFLTENETVDLYDYSDGWYTIVYEDQTAYVSELYIDLYGSENTEDASEEIASDANSSDALYDVTDDELKLLAAIIFCEAGGEVWDGKVAVGAVVLNRMESDLYPDTIREVIYQSGQFTPALTGWLDSVLAGEVNEDCYAAAEAALAGEDPTGGCLSFHAGSGGTITIGNQTFY